MDEIERLRIDVTKAETDLKVSLRFAEMDRDAASSNPDRAGFHHDRNADRVKHCEEKLKEARSRLEAALTTR